MSPPLLAPNHLLFLSAADGAVKKEGKGRQFRKRNPAKKGHKVGRGDLAGHRQRALGARGPPAGHGAPKDPCLWSRTLRPGSSPPTASWSTPTTSSVSFIGPTARDTQACGLLLLNPDPVIVDPYEEARVIGKCLSRALDVHTQATTLPPAVGSGAAWRGLSAAASALGCLPLPRPRSGSGALCSVLCALWPFLAITAKSGRQLYDE